MLKLLLLGYKLGLLFRNDAAAAPGFIELREPDVKRAEHRGNHDREQNNLGARIDLADQLAGELAQENLRVIAPGRRRSFHGRLLDKWRNVSTVTTPGHERGRRGNRKEMYRWTRRANPNFVSVINAFVGFNWPA